MTLTDLILPKRGIAIPEPPSYKVLDMAFAVGAGATLFDRSRYRNHGTIVNAVWGTGRHGAALSFDGSGDYVTIPASTNFDFAGDFSILVWVNLDALNRNLVKSVSNENWGSAATGDWVFDIGGTGRAALYVKGVGVITGAFNVGTAAWVHVAVTRVSGSTRIYQGGLPTGGTLVSTATFGNTQTLQIGRNQGALDLSLDGLLDRVTILKVGLSAGEIWTMYNAT